MATYSSRAVKICSFLKYVSIQPRHWQVNYMSTSSVLSAGARWRVQRGLPENWTTPGERITDTPDWSYADGRPGCLGFRQKKRIIQQMEYANKVVSLLKQVDFAVERDSYKQKEKARKQITAIDSQFKVKGYKYETDPTPPEPKLEKVK